MRYARVFLAAVLLLGGMAVTLPPTAPVLAVTKRDAAIAKIQTAQHDYGLLLLIVRAKDGDYKKVPTLYGITYPTDYSRWLKAFAVPKTQAAYVTDDRVIAMVDYFQLGPKLLKKWMVTNHYLPATS